MNKSAFFIHHEVIKEGRIYFLFSLKLSHKHLYISILDFAPQVTTIVLQIPPRATNILRTTITDLEKSKCHGRANASFMTIKQSIICPLTDITVGSQQVFLIRRYKTMVVLLNH
jgi:hypothetical protein